MEFELLEIVVLNRNVDDHGLEKGDLGTVVEVYEPDGLEVEFVAADGKTQGVVTLDTADVRKVKSRDIIAVRPLQSTG